MAYIACTLLIVGLYLFLQIYFTHLWDRRDPTVQFKGGIDRRVSVVIAARNEEANIEACLQSIVNQTYPPHLMDVFLVDNHSTDDTLLLAATVKDERIKIFALKDHLDENATFKKEALQFGIAKSTAEWIVTIDADCVAPARWLHTIMSHADTHGLDMLLGPVGIQCGTSSLERYQQIEVAGLNVVTASGLASGLLLSANGANLAFRRSTFEKVGGYQHHKELASGDDVFLLQAFYRSAANIGYLKSPQVWIQTSPARTLNAFLNQRIRWASKTSVFDHWPTKLVSGIVFLNSCLLLLHLMLIPWFGTQQIYLFAGHFVLKALADIYLLRMALHSNDVKVTLPQWAYALILNPMFIAYIGLMSILRPAYDWKGRTAR